jgi:hypothetical protein
MPFEDIEKHVEILRRVAAGYEIGSSEESALRLAALALVFIAFERFDEFEEFRQGKELTAEQRAHLDSLGLKY